jgi:hypothetical protein
MLPGGGTGAVGRAVVAGRDARTTSGAWADWAAAGETATIDRQATKLKHESTIRAREIRPKRRKVFSVVELPRMLPSM